MSDETFKLIQAIVYVIAGISYAIIIAHNTHFFQRVLDALHKIRLRWEKNGFLKITYSLRYEIWPIALASVIINILGWHITSSGSRDILYLDMVGTAMSAYLLGPWWGAIVGILTQGFNSQIYAHDSMVTIEPYMLVNIAAGLSWGLIARSRRFRDYFGGTQNDVLTQIKLHIWYLLLLGVLVAAITGAVGTMVASVEGKRPLGFALSQKTTDDVQGTEFGDSIKMFFDEQVANIKSLTGTPPDTPEAEYNPQTVVLVWLLRWIIFTFRFIPNTTICAALGLLAVKYLFPLFEQHLICDKDNDHPRGDSWVTLVICLLCYLLPFSPFYPLKPIFPLSETLLWYIPLLIFLLAGIYLFFRGTDSITLLISRSKRLDNYERALSLFPQESFFGAIVTSVLISMLIFFAGLFIVGPQNIRGTFATFFVQTIVTYLSAFYLLRFSRRQWAAALYSNGDIPEECLPQNVKSHSADSIPEEHDDIAPGNPS